MWVGSSESLKSQKETMGIANSIERLPAIIYSREYDSLKVSEKILFKPAELVKWNRIFGYKPLILKMFLFQVALFCRLPMVLYASFFQSPDSATMAFSILI